MELEADVLLPRSCIFFLMSSNERRSLSTVLEGEVENQGLRTL